MFVDTAALVALTVRRDSWNQRAREVQARLAEERAPLITSDRVLTEFLNFAARTPLVRSKAAEVVLRLQASARTTIIPADHDDWLASFNLYQTMSDKGWSLVDCSSVLQCRSRGVQRVFTHDRHFTQAGFEVLLH